MIKPKGSTSAKQICNFRVQTKEDWEDWKWFVKWCQTSGITTCRPVIAFIRTFRRSMDGLIQGLEKKGKREILNAFPLIIALDQQNTFVYSIQKPRRHPDISGFVNNYVTTSSKAWVQAYILDKARFYWKKGQKSFCFKDFREIKPQVFRRAILGLKRRKELIPLEPRTCPRFYELLHPEGEVVQ